MSLPIPVLFNQRRQGIPGLIKSQSRALYLAKGGAYSSTRLLDQSPLNSGTRRTGESGRCLVLNGTNQAARIPDNTALDITDNLTVSVWAKNDNSSLSITQFLIGKYDTGANKREWAIGFNANEKLMVFIGSSSGSAGNIWESTAPIDIENLNLYCLTFESGVINVHKNGVDVDGSVTTGAMPASLFNESSDLMVGSYLNNNSSVVHWDGQIFDARIYAGDSTVLTAEQKAAIYNDPTSNIQFAGQDLRAHYKLDEQDGTTIYDSSGNENHGTVENAVLPTIHGTQDKLSFQNQVGFNKRMYFDGVNDYVSVGNVFNMGTSDFYVEGSFITNIIGPYIILGNKNELVSNVSKGYQVYLETGGTLRANLTDGVSRITAISSTVIQVGVKYDFRVEWDRSANLTIYINGAQDGTTPDISSMSGVNISNSNPLKIGADFLSVYQGWNGSIYDININGIGMYNGYGNTDADWIDQIGSNNGTVNGSPLNYFLPRAEDDTSNDIFGQALGNTGRRPNDAQMQGSNCLTADGTLYIAAAHLVGTETVVSSGGTSTPSISAGRIDFTAGTCWDLTLSDGTHYKLAEGYGTAILDASGNQNHGILTSAVLANSWGGSQNVYHSNLLDGCGKRMYFDGTDDYVAVSGMTATSDYFGACTISAKFFITDIVSPQTVFSLGGAYRLYVSSGEYGINSGPTIGVSASAGYNEVSVEFNSSGQGIALTVNGSEVWTGAVNGANPSTFFGIGAREISGWNFFLKGLIYDFSITGSSVKNFSLNGYGNTDADWIDTTGTVDPIDITVNGSPEPYYIPAAQNGLDAFGQVLTDPFIDGKRNRAETEYAYNPDSTPEMGADQLTITVPSDDEFGGAFAASDQIFSRVIGDQEDRITIAKEPQSGAELSKFQQYTQS